MTVPQVADVATALKWFFFNFCFYAASDLQLLKAAAIYELAKSLTHPLPFYTALNCM